MNSIFNSRTILIVEDNQLLSLIEEQIVERLGCKVVGKVPSGEEAVVWFKRLYPDCILIDINLEGKMNGMQVVQRIREQSRIPVIYITGDPELLSQKCKLQKGFTEVIVKPFTGQKLYQSLERIFQKEKVSQFEDLQE